MFSKTVSPWCLIGLIALSWLTLPCSAKNRVNTERYIDGLENESVRVILDLEPAPWQDVEQGHLGRLLIPRPCKQRVGHEIYVALADTDAAKCSWFCK
jgi:hypothetical protein